MIPEQLCLRGRPSNCSPELGRRGEKEVRCPYCGFFHLREGYCQALDPRNPNYSATAAARAPVYKAPVNTTKPEPVNKPAPKIAAVNKPVNTAPVHKPSVNTSQAAPAVHAAPAADDAAEKRKAYRREWMARKRAEKEREPG